jgi:hypothetical protein
MKEIQKKWDNICSSAKTEFSHKKKNAEKQVFTLIMSSSLLLFHSITGARGTDLPPPFF